MRDPKNELSLARDKSWNSQGERERVLNLEVLEEMQYSAFTDRLCHKIVKPHISVLSSFRMTLIHL